MSNKCPINGRGQIGTAASRLPDHGRCGSDDRHGRPHPRRWPGPRRLAVSPAVTTRSSASGSSGGPRDGNALCGTFDRAGGNQLVALLGPDSPVAANDRRRPGVRVIAKPAHDDGIAVSGERNVEALSGLSNRAGTDQRWARSAGFAIDHQLPGKCAQQERGGATVRGPVRSVRRDDQTGRARDREAYIKSQAHAGWRLVRSRYDDGEAHPGNDLPLLLRPERRPPLSHQVAPCLDPEIGRPRLRSSRYTRFSGRPDHHMHRVVAATISNIACRTWPGSADPASHPQAAGAPRGCARLLATAADQHRTTGCHPQNQL